MSELDAAVGREFYKLSGAGNDFVAVVLSPASGWALETGLLGELARKLCRRGVSIGADGFVVLEQAAPGRVHMSYLNADGGQADLCLNGTRCAAALAFELGWGEADQVILLTGAGEVSAVRTATGVRMQVPAPTAPVSMELDIGGEPVRGHFCDSGVPHFVVRCDRAGWSSLEINGIGAAIRNHEALAPAGANANFVLHEADQVLPLRTYERGVEAETLACGTGAVAAAAALGLAERSAEGSVSLSFETRGGFVLTVSRTTDGRWSLEGDARIVARGAIASGALV